MSLSKQKDHQDTKRVKHDSSRTLDHFFSRKQGPATIQVTADTRNSTPRRNTTLKPRLNAKPGPSNSEIITIESDDEPEVLTTRIGLKKRRLSEDLDIEIIDVKSFPAKRAAVANVREERRIVSNSDVAAVGSSSSNFAFGKPSLLSSTAPDFHPPACIAFGAPGGLLSPTIQDDPSTSNSILVQRSLIVRKEILTKSDPKPDVFKENIHVDIDLSEDASEDWLMGDDESGNTYQKEEDDEEVEFVEDTLIGGDGSESAIDFCPCCEQRLRSLQPSVRPHLNFNPLPSSHESIRKHKLISTTAWIPKKETNHPEQPSYPRHQTPRNATRSLRQAVTLFQSSCLPSKKTKPGKKQQ
ncbi:hypothetical protein P691DRAFT_442960 [Macrolepiota fuliginosa MF-IS2]|uniref:Uncharacterized protein n=1 Tax=Macrolepiota fuliginosa MF-IS2 TaxID=1400762 RepID=A0A9P6C6P3_9AGAR|nr:hypothetical protein P691DRAFT_442960 [Macrolepiota fuliginosa MF-IS2]